MNQLSVNQDIGYITLNHPPSNCLSPDVMVDLISKLNDCSAASVRAVVLRSGLENMFSAGIDPDSILSTDLNGRKAVFRKLGSLINTMLHLGVPVIADINGPAQAGGAVLAAIADFVVIQQDFGKICFSEIKVRLSVPRSIQCLVAAKVPPGELAEMLVLGKNINAQDAVRVGLAQHMYHSEEERQSVIDTYLSKIKRLDPAPLSRTLRDLKQPLHEAMQQFDQELDSFAAFLTDEYLGKGLRDVIRASSKSTRF